jgi:hypothetical protein
MRVRMGGVTGRTSRHRIMNGSRRRNTSKQTSGLFSVHEVGPRDLLLGRDTTLTNDQDRQ